MSGLTVAPIAAVEPAIEVVTSPADPDRVTVASRRRFSAGDAIWPVSGAPTAQSPRTIQVGSATHVEDAGGLVHLNHSCRPNAVIDASGLPMLFALRDITAGEELTVFYPSTEWTMVRPFVCSCGAAECVRIVAGARYLSVDVLSRYFANPHIRHLMSAAIASRWESRPSGTSTGAAASRWRIAADLPRAAPRAGGSAT
jgi:hypothetical protein